MRVRLIALLLLTTASLLSQAPANADIIRCNDANGKTLYTDSACPVGMRAVSVTSFPQSCTTEDCERRRESDLKEALERVRAEKEQLAAYSAERNKREIEDRWLDEARYEAELRDGKARQAASNDEGLYPVYPLTGFRRCCLAFPHHWPRLLTRISDIDHKNHHMKIPDERRGAAGNERRHLHRGTVPSGRLAINMK
jgi:hypothetical protein